MSTIKTIAHPNELTKDVRQETARRYQQLSYSEHS